MNFPACTHKSQNFAQSQQNFAPLHDGETVTFRNSAYSFTLHIHISTLYTNSVHCKITVYSVQCSVQYHLCSVQWALGAGEVEHCALSPPAKDSVQEGGDCRVQGKGRYTGK